MATLNFLFLLEAIICTLRQKNDSIVVLSVVNTFQREMILIEVLNESSCCNPNKYNLNWQELHQKEHDTCPSSTIRHGI